MNLSCSIEEKFNGTKEKNKIIVDSGINLYNPLTSIRKAHEEVGLHSQMLFSLLNPEGEHYQGVAFLREFIDLLGVDIENLDDELAVAGVLIEDGLGSGLGRIDLLVELKSYWIIIENKIYAGDQKKQIQRYVEAVESYEENREEFERKKKIVVYLTPSGKRPSDQSCGSREGSRDVTPKFDLLCVSYTNVLDWCNKCADLPAVEKSYRLRSVFEFYADVVSRIIRRGRSISDGEIVTNEKFFIEKLEDGERQYIFNRLFCGELSNISFLKKNLIPNSPDKDLKKLVGSSLNLLLKEFIEKITDMAAEDGYVRSTYENGFPMLGGKKWLLERYNWFSAFDEKRKKDVRKNKIVAFNSGGKSLWFVIFLAKSRIYCGFLCIKDGRAVYPDAEPTMRAYERYDKDNPQRLRFLCQPLLSLQHYIKFDRKVNDEFDINREIFSLRNPENFYNETMKPAMEKHLPNNQLTTY